MMADMNEYVRYIKFLFGKFPQDIQEELRSFINREAYADPRFQDLIMKFWYKGHLCLTDPWPDAMNRAVSHLAGDILLKGTGPNPFDMKGFIAGWNRFNDLPGISVPSLIIGAKYDSMDPEHLRKMAEIMPRAEFRMCDGGHFSMWDDTEKYFGFLMEFFNRKNDI